jgi:hypothetical protein
MVAKTLTWYLVHPVEAAVLSHGHTELRRMNLSLY